MASIRDKIQPIISETETHRSAFTMKELAEMGFRHPSERQWRSTLRLIPFTLATTTILGLLYLHFQTLPLLLFAAGSIASILGIVNSAIRDLIGARLIRPDVFLSYSFATSADHQRTNPLLAIEVSPFVAFIAAFLWPTWGVLSIIPPYTVKASSA